MLHSFETVDLQSHSDMSARRNIASDDALLLSKAPLRAYSTRCAKAPG